MLPPYIRSKLSCNIFCANPAIAAKHPLLLLKCEPGTEATSLPLHKDEAPHDPTYRFPHLDRHGPRPYLFVMQPTYISLKQARERIITTLFVLDQDMREWQAMRDAIREDDSRRNRRKKKEDIEQEFDSFFNSSAQIRRKLTDYLSLFENVAEN